jgi:hypothetical protein
MTYINLLLYHSKVVSVFLLQATVYSLWRTKILPTSGSSLQWVVYPCWRIDSLGLLLLTSPQSGETLKH